MKNFLTACILLSSFLFIGNQVSGQTYDPFYGEVVNNSSYDILLDNLETYADFGVKRHGTMALNNAKEWIIDQYEGFGYSDIVEDPFSYFGNTSYNIIVTKTGSVYPDKYLIIDGHYDSVNGVGANDNGSGTVLILEIARLLANIDLEYSIKFIHFAGEEDGLRGSQHYVSNVVRPTNMDILLVFNIDQVGGVNGEANTRIVCERDESNPPYNNNASRIATDQLAECVRLYSDITPEISYAYGSDYVPFENNGEVITGLYESNESPYPHSSQDVISNMDIDFLHEVTKASIGASLHFAIVYDTTSMPIDTTTNDTMTVDTTLVGLNDHIFKASINIYPNPTNGNIAVDLGDYFQNTTLKLVGLDGKVLKVKKYTNSRLVDFNIEAPSGIYFLNIHTKDKQATFKIIKKGID